MGIIRLLLALAVVVTHSGLLFGLEATRSVGGKLAVQIFYTISGFYMALILNRKYVGPGSYRSFLINRLLRLYPAYATVGMVTLFTGLAVYAGTGKEIWLVKSWLRYGGELAPGAATYLLATNLLLWGQDASMFLWIPPGSGALTFVGSSYQHPLCQGFLAVPQAWTVGVELWFYLLAPLLVRRVAVTVILAGAGLALRLVLVQVLGLRGNPWDYCFFPCELSFFLLGALAFKLYCRLEGTTLLRRRVSVPVFVVTLTSILAFRLLPWGWYPISQRLLSVEPFLLLFPWTLPFVFSLTKESAADRWVGELSYPVYVSHFIVIELLRLSGVGWVDRNLGLLSCLVSLAAALALWFGVDRPVDAWRQQLAHRGARSSRRATEASERAVAHSGELLESPSTD